MEQMAGSEKGTEYEKNNRKTTTLRNSCRGNKSKFFFAGTDRENM